MQADKSLQKAKEPPPTRPQLPADDFAGSAVPTITQIVEWAKPLVLKAVLEQGIGKGCSLEEIPPLDWDAARAKAAVKTYKEMWSLQHSSESLTDQGLYEAGGSLWWCSPIPECSGEVAWSTVVRGLGLLRPKEFAVGKMRVRWPLVLETGARRDAIPRDRYPAALQLLHGHVVVFSWWLAVYKALSASDTVWLTQLIECALSATVCVRILENPAAMAAASIQAASQTWEMDVLNEPFHLFAYKLSVLIDALPKAEKSSQVKTTQALLRLYKEDLRYQGKVLNKSMLSAAVAITNSFPEGSPGAKWLSLVFQWYGPILCSYSRIYRVVTTVNGFLKEVPTSEGLQQAGLDLNKNASLIGNTSTSQCRRTGLGGGRFLAKTASPALRPCICFHGRSSLERSWPTCFTTWPQS